MCHHGKEKGLKFPAMEGVGIPKENRPIGQMLFEHAEGRMYILYQMTESTDNDVFDKNIFYSIINNAHYIVTSTY